MEKDRRSDEEIREPAAWLRGTAWRIVQAGFRTSQGRLVTVDQNYLEQVVEVFESQSTVDMQQARLAALARCLEKVSGENREILHRHYVQGMGYDQIAITANRSSGALRVLVHRVVRQLLVCIRKRLEAEY